MNFFQFTLSVQSILGKPLEKWLRSREKTINNDLATLWIIGAPRSGTTLVYQLMCLYFEGYYLTNRVAKRYRISVLTRKLERLFLSKSPMPNSFQSTYGNTDSSDDPHEGGQFFYQFFPKGEPYANSHDVSGVQKENLKKIIEDISQPHKLFISKNTFHSLRINILTEVFSKAVFIWVRRETNAIVYSIFKARRELNIPDNDWWGVKPPGWEKAQSLPVIEKTVWQVVETEKIIKNDLLKNKAKYIEVPYEDVCESPAKMIVEIENCLSLNNYVRQEIKQIPNQFPYSSVPKNSISKKIDLAIKSVI